MKLENQVCSLALARKLKKLGVKQEGLYYYSIIGCLHCKSPYTLPQLLTRENNKNCSAFTVAELGRMLPKYLMGMWIKDWYMDSYKTKHNKDKHTVLELTCHKDYIGYNAVNEWCPTKIQVFNEKTEANARAKMLIYLLENKLIKWNP